MRFLTSLFTLALASSALAAIPAPQRLPDGLLFDLGDHRLRLTVCADNIVRVTESAARDGTVRPSIGAVPPSGPVPAWTWTDGTEEGMLSTAALRVGVDSRSGRIRFLDADGRPVLVERPEVKHLIPALVQGEQTWHVQDQWEPNDNESFHGLGQYQFGLSDLKGYDFDLWQHNTAIAVPFLVSSRGYGILWDNCSHTHWGDLRPFEPIAIAQFVDREGKPGALTASYFAGRDFSKLVATQRDTRVDIRIPDKNDGNNSGIHPLLPVGEASVRWEGEIVASASGDYQFQAYFDGDFKLWIDGRPLINHWRQDWLAGEDMAKVNLQAGSRHHICMEWIRDMNSTSLRVDWKTPSASQATALWSEVGDGVDYYFVQGPSLDRVIAGYRTITGRAAMMPRWAFGLWQSRERYETAQQSLDAIDEFRRRGIPFDNIVQDWQYWRKDQWGSHEFDKERFPDPVAWVNGIHDRHAQVMISVWGKYYAGTANYDEMLKAGYLFESTIKEKAVDFLGYPFAFFDAFNPDARKLFWRQMKTNIYSAGVDAWWMDASEPDLTSRPGLEEQKTHINPNHMGTGSRMLLGYPLLIASAVWDGQREAAPDKRVFNLTRSGYLGLQRYGAASWSGDITSTWTAMRKQITAGLGYSISGLPYWTMDIGGFSVPERFSIDAKGGPQTAEWRELNTRWFQFGTFVPLLRVHGQVPRREMWFFGDKGEPAYDTMLTFDRLRYRLLPYIYSLAGAATQDGGTLMRPLVMDFPGDALARSLTDQYNFGPALMVSPVTTYRARTRSVYLPPTTGGWYDFWTGSALGSGKTIEADAPFERLPLMVRAGSILPLGPELQYAAEKPSDPITLLVYTGKDATFSLYEDDGLSNGYEKGAFARIPITWNETARTLSIGAREGRFEGMLAQHHFRIVLISPAKPVPFSFEPGADVELNYDGSRVQQRL